METVWVPLVLTHISMKSLLAVQAGLICGLSFQYGFNIAALNSLQQALSCGKGIRDDALLPICFDMTPNQFGFLSSCYTLGGLTGSLLASGIADTRGRRTAALLAATVIGTGSTLMALAPRFFVLVLGRFVIGIGCGLSTVIVPTYLSEIAPPERKGSIGVLNQLGIVTGLLAGQSASLGLASPRLWRFVMTISAVIAAVQVFSSAGLQESPVWSSGRATHNSDSAAGSSEVLFDEEAAAQERLLDDARPSLPSSAGVSSAPPTTMSGVLTSPITRKGLRIVLLTQITQQASGVNAVMYFSTDIMKTALPDMAGYIALLITGVNFIMTFAPLVLADKIGRRPLLLTSTSLMCCTALLLSLTINSSAVLASISILSFVCAFAIGLGPIPFLLIGEVVPSASTAATGSLGLAVNWTTNFLVGASFMPLSGWLGPQGVFAGFAAILATATILIATVYR